MVARRVWTCPNCGQGWSIPAHAPDPTNCPKCPKPAVVEIQKLPPVTPHRVLTRSSRVAWTVITAVIVGIFGLLSAAAFFAMKPSGVGVAQFAGQVEQQVKKAIADPVPRKVIDREFAMVNQHLKENLDDAEYEVVKWWPAVARRELSQKRIQEEREKIAALQRDVQKYEAEIDKLKKLGTVEIRDVPLDLSENQSRMIALRHQIADAEDGIGSLRPHIDDLTDTLDDMVCRLKFRARNRLGAKILVDTIFVVEKDRMYAVPEGEDRFWWLRRELESLFGTKPAN